MRADLSDHDSERVLVRRALAGDAAAFERLVELHAAQVYRAALAVVTDHADALDVTQETWIKAWRGLAGFRGEAALATWLTRLARNAATDHLRRRRVRRAAAERVSGPPSLAPSLDAVEDREALRAALGGLPAAQRRLVQLRHELDLRLDEIALVLGIPEGTVKSRLHAALSALRAWLADGHGDDFDGRDLGSAPDAPGARPRRSWPGGAVGPELRPPAERPASAEAKQAGAAPSRARRCKGDPARPDRAGALRACRRRTQPPPAAVWSAATTPSRAARVHRAVARLALGVPSVPTLNPSSWRVDRPDRRAGRITRVPSGSTILQW